MEQVKVTIALILAILAQWSLRNVAEPFAYVDFPLIIIVFAALQRNSMRAIIYGTLAGLAVDAVSSGLLGANGFTKTLVAYAVSELARRVYLDNLFLRMFVIAGACLVDDLAYYGLHQLLGVTPSAPLVTTVAYSFIGTLIAGTMILFVLDYFSSDRLRPRRRESLSPRRQSRRRNPIKLGR